MRHLQQDRNKIQDHRLVVVTAVLQTVFGALLAVIGFLTIELKVLSTVCYLLIGFLASVGGTTGIVTSFKCCWCRPRCKVHLVLSYFILTMISSIAALISIIFSVLRLVKSNDITNFDIAAFPVTFVEFCVAVYACVVCWETKSLRNFGGTQLLATNPETIQDIPADFTLADQCTTDDTIPPQYSLSHPDDVARQQPLSFFSVSHVAHSLNLYHTWFPRLPSYEELEFESLEGRQEQP